MTSFVDYKIHFLKINFLATIAFIVFNLAFFIGNNEEI